MQLQMEAWDPDHLTNLTKLECLDLYTNPYGHRTNLLIVTENSSPTVSLTLLQYTYQRAASHDWAQIWPCANQAIGSAEYCTNRQKIRAHVADWEKFGDRVLYCVNEKKTTGDLCRLNYSPPILIGRRSSLLTQPAAVLIESQRYVPSVH